MVLPMIKTNMSTSDMMGLAISAAKFDIVGSKGWPYAHKGGNIGGVYYDIGTCGGDNNRKRDRSSSHR